MVTARKNRRIYRKKRTGMSSYAKKKSLTKLVKKVIKRTAEKKYAYYAPESGGIPVTQAVANKSNVAFINNIIPLTPYTGFLTVAQGTAENQRVGNSISPTYASLKMQFHPYAQDATVNVQPQPQEVMIWVFKMKGVATDAVSVYNAVGTSFLKHGSTNIGLTGTSSDWLWDVNTDLFTIYWKRKVKIGNALLTGTGNTAGQNYFSNNDFKMSQTVSINLTKFGYPKKLKFNDTSTSPMTNPLYVMISPTDSDGGTNASTTNAVPLTMDFIVKMDYIDI